MADKIGVARLRQAIENQRDAGEGEFHLTYHDAEEIAAEIDAELLGICSSAEREIGRYAWAHGVPAPVDADGEIVPFGVKKLYAGDGRALDVELIGFDGRWVVKFDREGLFNLDWFHFSEPDSWERLEEDVNLGCRDYCERYRLEECEYNVRAHMLERTKALAERREVVNELRKQAAYGSGLLGEWWQRWQKIVTGEVDFANPTGDISSNRRPHRPGGACHD